MIWGDWMVHNIVIGTPLVDLHHLLAQNPEDWDSVERQQTLFTEQRFLPAILKEAGIVQSTSEVRRNKPVLVTRLDKPDCLWVTWGRKKVYIVVGE